MNNSSTSTDRNTPHPSQPPASSEPRDVSTHHDGGDAQSPAADPHPQPQPAPAAADQPPRETDAPQPAETHNPDQPDEPAVAPPHAADATPPPSAQQPPTASPDTDHASTEQPPAQQSQPEPQPANAETPPDTASTETQPAAEPATQATPETPTTPEAAAKKPTAGVASPPPVRTGTIASVRGQDVVVEFTGRRAGICPLATFAKPPRIGQRVGFVIAPDQDEDAKGPLKLLRPAVGAAAPDRKPLKEINVGDTFDATVVGMNTGGLEVKIAGHRAFLPASQIDRHRIENFVPYLNRTLRCRVLELNRRKRRIVVSHRSILDDEDRAKLGEKIAHIKPGEVRECRVRNVEKFGVFLEWEPGIDGLVRLPDLAHNRVDDPRSVLSVGDTVKAKVLHVDPKKARLSLGIRQATPSPWRSVEERYPVGSDQTGAVTRTADFGAFVELEPGIEGLIHISQLAPQRVERVEQVVKEGQQVTARVVQCDGRRKRIGLSIRALTEPEAMPAGRATRDDMRKYVKKEKQAHAGESLGALMDKFGGSDGLKGGIG